jgi:hypothetical protein
MIILQYGFHHRDGFIEFNVIEASDWVKIGRLVKA